MQVEDEILSEIERRDTEIMLREAKIEQQNQEIEKNRQALEQNRQELEQSKQLVCSMVSLLQASGLSVGEIAGRLNLDEHEVGKMLGNR